MVLLFTEPSTGMKGFWCSSHLTSPTQKNLRTKPQLHIGLQGYPTISRLQAYNPMCSSETSCLLNKKHGRHFPTSVRTSWKKHIEAPSNSLTYLSETWSNFSQWKRDPGWTGSNQGFSPQFNLWLAKFQLGATWERSWTSFSDPPPPFLA